MNQLPSPIPLIGPILAWALWLVVCGIGPSSNPGVNFRAVRHLFHVVLERQETHSYEFEISMLEVYNESIRDLLSTTPASSNLTLMEGSTGIIVKGLTKRKVQSPEEVFR